MRQLSNVCSCLVTHASPRAWIDAADIERLQPEVFSGPRNPNPEAYAEGETATYSEALRAFRERLILDRTPSSGSRRVDSRRVDPASPIT